MVVVVAVAVIWIVNVRQGSNCSCTGWHTEAHAKPHGWLWLGALV